MKNLINSFRQARELKRLAREKKNKTFSLTDDIVFKIMFSSNDEDSREALRSLLSVCTRREVSKVQIMNNDLFPAHLEGKFPRLDVKVTFNDGETADLEMQTSKSNDDLRKRSEYLTSLLLAAQSRKGESYRDIKRVYQIFFLNCILFTKSDSLTSRFYFQEEKRHERLSDLSEIIFYELPKLEKRFNDYQAGKIGIKTLTKEEKWGIYLRYRNEENLETLVKSLCQEEEGIMRAEKAAQKISRSYLRYLRKMDELIVSMDRAQMLLEAREEGMEMGLQEGRELGLEAGREEGIQQGRQEGRQQGRQEGRQEGGEYVLELITQGLSPEQIKERLQNNNYYIE